MKRFILLGLVLTSIGLCFQGCDSSNRQGCDDPTPEERYEPPAPADSVNPAASPLVAEGHYFRDSSGGVVFLHGINVAGNSKVPPFKGITSESQLEVLPALGVNTIRLLFTWEAFEPVQGEYSDDYLAYYKQVVQWADQLGLYVVVDFHQDAYSRYALRGCGEGFPQWAVTPEVTPATPDNDASCRSWGVQMLINQSLNTTWSHFHSDKYGAKRAYLAMVGKVVEQMSTHDNVIGYELINEPMGSDEELFTLFDQVGKRIRQKDPDAILFIPTHTLVSGGTRKDTLDRPDFDNMAYSPHYYNGSVLLLKNWPGTDPSGQLDKLREKADNWGVPMFLSEFGAPAGTKDGLGYIAAQLDWLDEYWIASAQWNYTPGWREDAKDGWNMEDLSIVDDQGALRDNFVLRPHPQRIGGAPQSFILDNDGFTLAWKNNPAYGATIVFVPEGYADGKKLSVNLPEGAAGACAAKDYTLVCNIEGAGETVVSLK